jgi:hypothetical protein
MKRKTISMRKIRIGFNKEKTKNRLSLFFEEEP